MNALLAWPAGRRSEAVGANISIRAVQPATRCEPRPKNRSFHSAGDLIKLLDKDQWRSGQDDPHLAMVVLPWRTYAPNGSAENAMPWATVTRLGDKDENQARIQERTSRAWLHCRAEERNRLPNHPARTRRFPETGSNLVHDNVDGILTLGFTARIGTCKAAHDRQPMQAIARCRSKAGAGLIEMMGFRFELARRSIVSSARASSEGRDGETGALAAADRAA
jgi:hypothetical protein